MAEPRGRHRRGGAGLRGLRGLAAGLAGLWAAGAAALDNGLGRTPPM